MVLKGEAGAEKEALAAALGRQRGRSFQRKCRADLARRGVDHGDGIVRPIRHVQALAVGRERQALGRGSHRDARDHIVRRCREVVGQRAALRRSGRADELQHPRDVDHRHAVRPRRRNVRGALVRRQRDRKRRSEVAIELVERKLHRFARHVHAEHRNRIAEDPAVFHVRQRDQVLGPQLRRHSQSPIGRNRDVEHPGRIGQPVAFPHCLPGRVDDSDVGFGRRAVFARVRVDVRAVNGGAIGGAREVAGAAARRQAFEFGARCQVHDRDVVADAVGHVKETAGEVGDDGVGFESRGQRANYCEGVGVDLRDRIAPGIGDVEARSIRRKREAFRDPAHSDAAEQSWRSGCRTPPPRRCLHRAQRDGRRPGRPPVRRGKGSAGSAGLTPGRTGMTRTASDQESDFIAVSSIVTT